jgi:dephospho-CoA kinase
MRVVGILGGVASGKTFVTECLRDLGAAVLDGDKTGHEVLRLPEIEAQARQRWGDAIFDPEGRIHRRALAQIVFAPPPDGPRELHYLEQLTHPLIGQRLQEQIAALAVAGQIKACVLDAPVMLKAGWHKFCDIIVFVDAPRDVRLARARSRGWSQEDFAAREGAQESVDQKKQAADVVIDNSGSPESTRRQVERFWNSHLG